MTSYHDLYVTTESMERTAFSNMTFGHMVICTRVGGWELWFHHDDKREQLVAGGFDTNGLRLDVNGTVICDSLKTVDRAA